MGHHMATAATPEGERIRALAQSLDCMTEEDLNLLTGTTPSTTLNWRKRGKGPAYTLIGNRVLYPRTAVAEYLQRNLRERSTGPGCL